VAEQIDEVSYWIFMEKLHKKIEKLLATD